MAHNPRNRGAVRTLIALFVLTLAVFGGIVAANRFMQPQGQFTPLLGLDLAGGRQIVLEPVVTGDNEISPEQVDQAIDIVRNRIDGTGVSEAEVSRLGATNLSVAIPGTPTQAQLDALSRSSQLQFRTILQSGDGLPASQQPQDPQEPAQPTEPPRLLPTPEPAEPADPGTEEPGEEPTVDEGAWVPGLLRDADPGAATAAPAAGGATTEPTPAAPDGTDVTGTPVPDDAAITDAPIPGDSEDSTQAPFDPGTPATEPTNASDPAWITPEVQQAFDDLDCSQPTAADIAAAADPAVPTVACSAGGVEKYILGPAEVLGSSVTDATAGLQQGAGGQATGVVEVRLSLDGEGASAFAEVTSRLFSAPPDSPENRFAMVLDGQVISAPGVNSPINDGQASISGSFTMESAENLANQLRFGALPISFSVQTSEQISPTLGAEQLEYGLIAAAVGLLLVFAYSLFQYRALGFVTIGSLIVSVLLTYGVITLLGSLANFRLSMAGVTGLIVAIGMTADSFIVYFERVRDEVRNGRPLRHAVDTGWRRARRTILISDAVNLIAAGVLYVLSESNVRAFAYALGIATIIDLVVVLMFTHPVMHMLANTKFFGEGHKWSGMDPESLGAKRFTYLGRGQFRDPEPRKKRRSSSDLPNEGAVV